MNTAINFRRSAAEEPPFAEEEPRLNWYHRTRHLGRHANKLVIIGLLVLFVLVYFWQFMFFTVQSGEVGVLYLLFGGGTQTDRVLGEGMKVIAPWDKLFIYNVRVQEVKHEMPALTAEGLMVTLEVSIRFHPELELVGLLHQRVGPDYTDRIVIPEVESALREKVGSSNITEVYRMQRSLLQEVAIEGFENVSRKYIRIDELILRSVKLPDAVRVEIENKMTQQEIARSYEYPTRDRAAGGGAALTRIERPQGVQRHPPIVSDARAAAVAGHRGDAPARGVTEREDGHHRRQDRAAVDPWR